ncbi:MAG: hypothetical protein IKQ22_00775 [Clostridia bacterium]|nr:hypothetical protein [Clostridia bacterium]
MVFKFEIDTSHLNDSNPESIEQTIQDFQMIIQVLCNANPDYYIIGGMLKEQMDKQVKQFKPDPKHDMIMQWDMILERDCMCNSRDEYLGIHHGDGIPERVDNFYAQIGEAMGPVSYAGFQLTQALKNSGLSTDWVTNCIQYYQDNWDF